MTPDQRARALRLADGLSSPMGEPGVTGWATMMDAANLLRELAAEPSPWPEGLRDRIESAIERINNRHAPRRIPADPTDVDLVLAEVRALMDGKDPPFWLKRAIPQDQQARVPLTDSMSRHSRAMLLNVLWHHQGASSAVGQPLRGMLGIGRFDNLSDEQLSEAKWIDALLSKAVREPERVPIHMERVDKSTSQHWWNEQAGIRMPSPELYTRGDTVLCWVNEGELLAYLSGITGDAK